MPTDAQAHRLMVSSETGIQGSGTEDGGYVVRQQYVDKLSRTLQSLFTREGSAAADDQWIVQE